MTERKDVASNDDMPELKPCPFCGGRLVKQPIEVDGCCIYDHPKNNCILALKMITNHQVDKWNTRTDTLNQQVPEQECTCDYTEIKMTDCPIHGLNAKKEPPADQDAVRELAKLVKAIHLSSDGQWLYGEYGEAEWIADRDTAIARLEGE